MASVSVGRIRQAFSRGTQEYEIRELTAQFYVTLNAYFARLVEPDTNAAEYKKIKNLLEDEPRSWENAYQIEQLLIAFYDDETLRQELEVRTMEARLVLRSDQAALYERELAAIRNLEKPPADSKEKPADADTLRARRRGVLARLVNDLQWRYTVNEATRTHTKTITSRAGILFLGALILFAGLIVYKLFCKPALTQDDLRLFWFALLSGLWGATFSILASLKDRLKGAALDELKAIRPWVMLFSRALIGAGAACIFYFFILAGVLVGSDIQSVFPNLSPPKDGVAGPLPVKQLALLVVWCFVAGFSERLVPGILEKLEARAGSNSDARSDRARPTGASSSKADDSANTSAKTGS